MSPTSDRGRLNRALWPLLLGAAFLGAGCAATPRLSGGTAWPHEPLGECRDPDARHCVAVVDVLTTKARDPSRRRFLEIGDASVRAELCAGASGGDTARCELQLAALADYQASAGPRDPAQDIGVALEGGGSKAAPFALGTIAGLWEAGLLPSRVRAVSSVSGGSYAASYLFQRLWDKHPILVHDNAWDTEVRGAPGDYPQWFRSCVPDAFVDKGLLPDEVRAQRCGELAVARPHASQEEAGQEACGSTTTREPYNEFLPDYAFLGQVWRWPDVLFSDLRPQLKPDAKLQAPDWWQTIMLTVASAATVPVEVVTRVAFRWPLNSAPSKAAYEHGIERQFGISPEDWQMVRQQCDPPLAMARRFRNRTLRGLGERLAGTDEPEWIVNASTPGTVTIADWLSTASRDPVVHSFELTPHGYGAGLYGYAKMPPVIGRQFDRPWNDKGDISISEAVVASAAFFDENQSLVSHQPWRFVVGAGQLALNLNWFTEIPNFNATTADRAVHSFMPYPLWGIPTRAEKRTPYIHLQDGGNSDNTGILALLRRGYRRIVYAHGTEDGAAKFQSLCHLKNILELRGPYRLDSADFEKMAEPFVNSNLAPGDHRFASRLDWLCSHELDDSIRADFGNETGTPSALSRLYCRRVGQGGDTCPAFLERFPVSRLAPVRPIPETWADPDAVFRNWTGHGLRFEVTRVADAGADCPVVPIATIMAVVPAIAWKDYRAQLDGPRDVVGPEVKDWQSFCIARERTAADLRVKACAVPADVPGEIAADAPTVPCTAAAQMLAETCAIRWSRCPRESGPIVFKGKPPICLQKAFTHPTFPQDNFISTTLNSSYLRFAAYFDLARHYTRVAVQRARWTTSADQAPPEKASRTEGAVATSAEGCKVDGHE